MKKNYIRNIILVLSIIGCTIAAFFFSDPSVIASAATFYDNDGFFTVTSSDYTNHPDLDYRHFLDSPIIGGNHTIPSDYSVIGKGCYIYPSQSYQLVYWIYAKASYAPFPIQLSTSDGSSYLYTSYGSGDFIIIADRVFSDGSSEYWNYNSSNTVNISGICSFYVPLTDRSTGSPIVPETQIQFNLNTTFDSNLNLYFNASSNSLLDNPVHFYLFPSSVNISSGSVSTVISDTYVTELSPSQISYINDYFPIIKVGEAYFDYLNTTTFGVIPKLVWSDSTSSTRQGSSFDPSLFGLPYLDLGSKVLHPKDNFYLSQTYMLNIPSMDKSRDGIYFYNDLCIVAVADFEGRYFTSRFDFSRSVLKSYGVTAPSYPSSTDTYSSGTVTDLQSLADYLKYLYQTNDSNRGKQDNNIIAYLQGIDWSGYMANGVAAGMANFLPSLSNEFDTVFNGLFDDFFVPDLDDIEEQVNADEAEFSAKFVWVTQIKQEVNFIVSTPLQSSGSYEYKIPIRKWGIQEDIVIFDTDWVPSTAKDFIKIVFDVFGTIALVFYIFKTLPSTLGNMPSD